MYKQYNEIINFLKKYQEETNCKGYVIGISGGKDSTVVAKLLVDAIGKENVLGVLMPNGAQSDLEDAYEVCHVVNIEHIMINIFDSYQSIINQISNGGYTHFNTCTSPEKITVSDKAKTNIAPRLRMTTLYAIAQSLGYRVAGTGNKSEQFIGWFTKWGDGACDINPIAHLTCTEVIELGDYLELPKHLIHKTPADGLTGKSDEENFGFTYKELDKYIEDRPELISDGCSMENFIIEKLHNNSRHKFSPTTIDNYGNE